MRRFVKLAGHAGVVKLPYVPPYAPPAVVQAVSFASSPNNTANLSAAATSGGLMETHRLIHTALVSGSGVKLRYINDSATATIYVAAMIEPTLAGTPIAVTFGGQTEVAIPPRSSVQSDVVPGLTLTAASQFAEQCRVRVANTGEQIVYGNTFGGSGKGGKVSGDGLGTTIGNTSTSLFGALAIGVTTIATSAAQIGLCMDSYNQHWPAKKWEGINPIVNMGRSGEGSYLVVGARLAEILAGLAGVPTVLVGYGHNDLLNHPTLTTLKTNLLTLWKAVKANGSRVIISTVSPHTDSTDAWLTETNQTRASAKTAGDEQNRQDYNAWVRDGAPLNSADLSLAATGASGGGIIRIGNVAHPVYDYVDAAAQIEATGTTGKWKTFAEGTGNITSGSPTITGVTTTKGAWVVGQDIRGGAGIPATTVEAVNADGANTVRMVSAATATSTGVQLSAPSTSDGLHPTLGYGRGVIGAAFPDASVIVLAP